GRSAPVPALAFCPDSAALATAFGRAYGMGPDGSRLPYFTSQTVILWDVASGKNRAVLRGHADTPLAVAFSPDSKTLATGGSDHVLKLWSAATGKGEATPMGHRRKGHAVGFAGDGKTPAS